MPKKPDPSRAAKSSAKRPRATRAGACLAALAGIAVMAACDVIEPERAGGGTPSFYARIDQGGPLDRETARAMISAYRMRQGLAPLTLDPALVGDAEAEAKALAAADALRPGAVPPKRPDALADVTRVSSAGYRTLAEAFSGWRDSPQHNKVMLKADGARFGIAAAPAPGSKYGVYWVMVVAGR